MRVVVTGATSMIGVAIINECIKQGDEVLAIVRENTTRINRIPSSDKINVVCADLSHLDRIDNSNIYGKYDVFYHIAWANTSKEGRLDPFAQMVNIQATLDAVSLAKKLGCKKFVGAGSQAEYGPCRGVIDADTPVFPQNAYGIAKLSANMLSRELCSQLDMVHIWGRIFSVYGTLDNDGTMINYAVDQLRKGYEAKFSAATQMWNYLFEEDAGKMFYLLGRNINESGIFCIASDVSMPLRKYIELIWKSLDQNGVCVFSDKEQSANIYELNVDVKKTTAAINYIPQTPFEKGIEKVIEYKKSKDKHNEKDQYTCTNI